MRTSTESIKEAVGKKAADLICNGMTVGLGTGSTSYYFVKHLGMRCQDGLDIRAVATSNQTMLMAERLSIPLISSDLIAHIDIAVDGADEVDPEKNMIKGAGGALLREKIIASMSREMVVIIDETKLVPVLGKRKLPIEITTFGYLSTLHKIEKLGYKAEIRKDQAQHFFITDSGNFILDVEIRSGQSVKNAHEEVRCLPGVIETGYFEQFAGRILVGFFDGQIVTRP